jgi:hypothetical protein
VSSMKYQYGGRGGYCSAYNTYYNILHYIILIRGNVSQYVANGCKTVVMDVIDFLCISIGNSIESSFMTVSIADVHAYVQRLVSVVKMATMLEDCTKKSSVLLCFFFLWAK